MNIGRTVLERRSTVAAWMIALAALVGGCSETRTDDAGDAASGRSSADRAAAAESGDPADDETARGIDALVRQAEQFAARQGGAEGEATGRDAGTGEPFSHAAGANEVRWLDDGGGHGRRDGASVATVKVEPGDAASANDAVATASGAQRDTQEGPGDAAAATETAATAKKDSTGAGGGANADAAASAPLSRAELVDRLVERMGVEDREAASLRPWLAKAAMSIVDPSHELSSAELARLDPEHRAIVAAYQRAFAQLGRALGEGRSADRALLEEAAVELADQVHGERPLTIRNVKLCKRVKGFGVYETFERNVFLAGRESPVIVYAELDHFDHRTEGDGRHAVELTQEIVLYNESDGLPVWRQKPTRIVDRSFNVRRDFFVVQVVRLSPRLTVGKYRLKVTITDEVGQTVDEASVPLRIVADANVGELAGN